MSTPYYPPRQGYNQPTYRDARYRDQRRYYGDKTYGNYYGGGQRGGTTRFSRDREDRKDEYRYGQNVALTQNQQLQNGQMNLQRNMTNNRNMNGGRTNQQNYGSGPRSAANMTGIGPSYGSYGISGNPKRRGFGYFDHTGQRGGRRQNYNNNYNNHYNNYNNNNHNMNNNNNNDNNGNERKVERRQIVDNFDYEADDWKEKIAIPNKDERMKTEDVTQTKGSSFEDFNLNRKLLRAIYELGFERPSPVQEESIPNILMRNNVLARAKNGTGKTAAYTIPILQLVDSTKDYIQALILVPTRELALQTAKVVKDLSKYLNIEVLCTTGGMSLRNDIMRLDHHTIHVVVATPGRILDLSRTGHAKLQKCGIVAIDEADKLLSPDFSGLIEKILKYIPAKQKDSQGDDYERQLLLYSATFPVQVATFCETWLSNRKEVNLMDDLTLKGVTQYYAYLNEEQKVHALYSLIKKLTINQCVIFAKSVTRVELLARKVSKLGFSCFYIHSRMNQRDRNRVFHEFRQGPKSCRFLVCTDLITRGVDVPTVNVVINFDFPKTGETYLHRIGRGGRFGHLSLAINFVTDSDRDRLYQVEHHLQTEIKPIPNDVDKIDKKLYAYDVQN